jgi:hypothetical protein
MGIQCEQAPSLEREDRIPEMPEARSICDCFTPSKLNLLASPLDWSRTLRLRLRTREWINSLKWVRIFGQDKGCV